MTPITLSFSFAFAAILFALIYLQKKFSTDSKDINISGFFAEIEQRTRPRLYRLYRLAFVLGITLSLVLFFIPMLSWEAAVSFFLGLAAAVSIAHTSFVFLIKLNSNFAQKTSYGLIESFNRLFGGGNILGVFILSSVLFFVSAHYILIGSSAAGIVSLGLGALFFGIIFKIGISAEADEGIKNAVLEPLSRVVEFSELFFSALVISVVSAALILPGFAGAIALPLLTGIAGIVASALSVRLIHMGSTTNIFKNITFSLLGVVLLSSIIAFPLIVWAMNENVQFSNIDLWLAVFLGLACLGVVTLLQYFKKEYLSHPVLMSALIPAGIYLSYLFAGLYGLSVFIVSLISASAAVFSMFIFTSAADNLERSSEGIDMPAEQKKIVSKLDSIAKAMIGGSRAYLWLISSFVVAGFYILYQNEIDSRLIQESFSLENPHVVVGIFLSIVGIFWGIKYIFPKLYGTNDTESWLSLDIALLKRISAAVLGIMLVPAGLAILLGAEIYSGFFLGVAVSAVLLTVPGSPFDIRAKSNYSAITKREEIISRVKILGAVSLLLVIFII